MLETLTDAAATATGVTDQNVQARLRGLLLMALANERNALALATGNKFELAMGYATLYGDMNAQLAVLGDVYKTEVQADVTLGERPFRPGRLPDAADP